MECSTFFLIVSILTFFYVITNKLHKQESGNTARLPPGPYPLPIIGNIFELRNNAYLSLASLSKTYGPLMSLKLGSTITIIASSPEIVKQILQEHDLSFSNRSVPESGKVINHHLFSMVWLPYGDRFRRLRRISKEHMFSVQLLDASKLLRKEKIQKLVDYVHECSISGKPVNIGKVAFTTSFNVLSSFIFSTEMASYDSLASHEFKDNVCALIQIVGKPNLADFFPILKPFDPQGLLKKGNVYAKKLMAILDTMVDQRVRMRAESEICKTSSTNKDILDLLLDIADQNNDPEFTRNDILHLLLDLFSAAADTTPSTIEWAMAELLHNPTKMAKARCEIEEIVKKDNMIVEESDICKLPYLDAIIKETLRLHPPVPFLLPRKALCDVELHGFIVPKDAQILCNVWAIGRDPVVWSEPRMFMTERFLDIKVDYKGGDFELLPFGSGRRICPGLPLAHRMLHLMLGSLICNFDWKLEGDMRPEDMDMTEKFGITLYNNVPLVAIPIKI